MTTRPDDDVAAIQVVEAILVAVLVAGALIFFALAQRPSFPADPSGRDQVRVAADALALLQGENPGDTTNAVSAARDKLSVLVGLAFTSPFDKAGQRNVVEETLPPGTAWSLRLYNGYGHLEVLASSDNAMPGRGTAGASAFAYASMAAPTGNTAVAPLTAGPGALGPACVLSFGGSTQAPTGVLWADLWRAWHAAEGMPGSAIVPDFAPFGDWTYVSGCGGTAAGSTLRVGVPSAAAPSTIAILYTVDLVVWDAF